jgi:hypothetical protein
MRVAALRRALRAAESRRWPLFSSKASSAAGTSRFFAMGSSLSVEARLGCSTGPDRSCSAKPSPFFEAHRNHGTAPVKSQCCCIRIGSGKPALLHEATLHSATLSLNKGRRCHAPLSICPPITLQHVAMGSREFFQSVSGVATSTIQWSCSAHDYTTIYSEYLEKRIHRKLKFLNKKSGFLNEKSMFLKQNQGI